MMVTVNARKALDLTKLNFGRFFDGENAFASSSTIKFDYPDTKERDRFNGAFTFDGGTVSGSANQWVHSNYKTGKTFFSLSNMKLSASAVLDAAETNKVSDDRAIIEKLLSKGDSITGSDFADKLYGYGGNDSVAGGHGKDTMDGGDGSRDLADFSAFNKVIEVTLDRATFATVKVGGLDQDIIRNFENFAGGHRSDVIEGDSAANELTGNAGDDTIDGGAGHDKLKGDAGNDSLSGAGGRDTLFGATNNDVLNGGAGNDSLDGGQHADTLNGGGGHDRLLGGQGTGADLLQGGTGDDTLDGGAGLDTLIGGSGKDVMTGGADADVFVFLAVTDSTRDPAGRDQVMDFVRKSDKIDLSAIDAITSVVGGDDAFIRDAKGTATTAVAEGHIGWYSIDKKGTANDRTYLRINNDADADIDMVIVLKGAFKLTASDFIL
jgi:serralysin